MRRYPFITWMIVMHASCVPVPDVAPAKAMLVVDDAPKFYSIPNTFKDGDLICVDPNQPGTCATVAEVRVFLLTRKVGP